MSLIKKYRRVISLSMAAIIEFTMTVSVNISETFADYKEDNNEDSNQKDTTKEEVVYINLKSDGAVKDAYVVNAFNVGEDGSIIDYGNYESVRNMTTKDNITYEDNTVSINTDASKIYYEGKLKSQEMPWDIDIHYYIDGKEYSPKKVAGKSGKLKIEMSIKKNKECDETFYKAFALQTSLTLDSSKCSNISTEGATIANVGDNKQLTYTILPNKGKDIVITADVKNFEMSEISINGIRMNLDIDINKDELQDSLDEVIGGVNDLDEGANELDDGTEKLSEATTELDNAVGELNTGVESLTNGAKELQNGLSKISSKSSQLTNGAMSAFKALCSAAETQLNEKLKENGTSTVSLKPTTYSKELMKILKKMDAKEVYKTAYDKAYKQVESEVKAKADELYVGYIKSQENSIYQAYIKSQEDALYTKVASEIAIQQLVATGLNEEQASVYLQSDEGKLLISKIISEMSKEQKEQILLTAVNSLIDAQKEQILQGALKSLTESQKKEIRKGYIDKIMASDDVTSQINKAVSSVSKSAEEVSKLKGQLDSYKVFYNGLVDYT